MTDREGVHTCHDECPCQTGGQPIPDFLPVEGAVLDWYGYLDHLARIAENDIHAGSEPTPQTRHNEEQT